MVRLRKIRYTLCLVYEGNVNKTNENSKYETSLHPANSTKRWRKEGKQGLNCKTATSFCVLSLFLYCANIFSSHWVIRSAFILFFCCAARKKRKQTAKVTVLCFGSRKCMCKWKKYRKRCEKNTMSKENSPKREKGKSGIKNVNNKSCLHQRNLYEFSLPCAGRGCQILKACMENLFVMCVWLQQSHICRCVLYIMLALRRKIFLS